MVGNKLILWVVTLWHDTRAVLGHTLSQGGYLDAVRFSLNGHSEAKHHGCSEIVLSPGEYSDFGEHDTSEADHFLSEWSL